MEVLFFYRHTFGTLWTIPISTQKNMEYSQKLLVLEKTALLEPTSEYPELPDSWTPNHESTFSPFCQDFSRIFEYHKRFDRKFQGEILKIERRNLEVFSPKFAVKTQPIFNHLIINTLQKTPNFTQFCQIFLPILPHHPTHLFHAFSNEKSSKSQRP